VCSVKLTLPAGLQRRLLHELECIEDKKLLTLPRDPHVLDVLDEFAAHMTAIRTKGSKKAEPAVAIPTARDIELFNQGLHTYFCRALPTILLYRFERLQFNELAASSEGPVEPGKVYGAEHLIRLFVKLPQLLAQVELPAASLAKFQQRFNELVKFLDKRASDFFNGTYEGASKQYCQDAADAFKP